MLFRVCQLLFPGFANFSYTALLVSMAKYQPERPNKEDEESTVYLHLHSWGTHAQSDTRCQLPYHVPRGDLLKYLTALSEVPVAHLHCCIVSVNINNSLLILSSNHRTLIQRLSPYSFIKLTHSHSMRSQSSHSLIKPPHSHSTSIPLFLY